ncbi:hypothetical protein FB565_002772 [Actinoplanes lutulentus]|nr:hypothetical protein [Actinoplanes lutulentus]
MGALTPAGFHKATVLHHRGHSASPPHSPITRNRHATAAAIRNS